MFCVIFKLGENRKGMHMKEFLKENWRVMIGGIISGFVIAELMRAFVF